jgi:pyruvate, water dikinase
LWQQERQLLKTFHRDDQQQFQPCLQALEHRRAEELSPSELLERIRTLLTTLERATFYSILAPLSVALRKSIQRVPDTALDYGLSPEVASLRSLQILAPEIQAYFAARSQPLPDPAQLETQLQQDAEGETLWRSLQTFLADYGYLSDVGTDIAIPTWKDDPLPIYALLLAPPVPAKSRPSTSRSGLQKRVDLKGQVATVYGRLLAELRWSFVALENQWRSAGSLHETGDIFFLELPEIEQVLNGATQVNLMETVTARKQAWQVDAARANPPTLVYGKHSPPPILRDHPTAKMGKTFQGIGASPGVVEGTVTVIQTVRSRVTLEPGCILVVPFTDSGWSPLLARASGLIAEVGGRLSHGAIVAREYGIPAVMDIPHATTLFQDGQRVRLDGEQGTVEILS